MRGVGAWVVAACAMMCGAAWAQEEAPAEDGLGPYKFGMSIEAAQESAPRAAWRIEPGDAGERVLSGGPRLDIGGVRMNAALVFRSNDLARITLLGAARATCDQAVTMMVEILEPSFGPFSAMPPWEDGGGLVSVERIASNSQLRVREVEGERIVVAARHGPMFVQATGRQAADGQCTLVLTFGPGANWPRPENAEGATWQEIDAAEFLFGSSAEFWIARPSSDTFARYYPPMALQSALDGYVLLDCLIGVSGELRCLVAAEAPDNARFGAAALHIASDFQAPLEWLGETTVGKRLRVPVRFETE